MERPYFFSVVARLVRSVDVARSVTCRMLARSTSLQCTLPLPAGHPIVTPVIDDSIFARKKTRLCVNISTVPLLTQIGCGQWVVTRGGFQAKYSLGIERIGLLWL